SRSARIKCVFALQQQVFGRLIPKAQTEPPQILRQRWWPRTAIARKGITIGREDLAETHRTVERFRETIESFAIVIVEMVAIIGSRGVVVVVQKTTGAFDVAFRQKNVDIALDQLGMKGGCLA